jgi:Flp pilus assembly protein TadG
MAQPARKRLARCTSGQALLETALVLPLLLALIFNVINFGYFFFVALNSPSAARAGMECSKPMVAAMTSLLRQC